MTTRPQDPTHTERALQAAEAADRWAALAAQDPTPENEARAVAAADECCSWGWALPPTFEPTHHPGERGAALAQVACAAALVATALLVAFSVKLEPVVREGWSFAFRLSYSLGSLLTAADAFLSQPLPW